MSPDASLSAVTRLQPGAAGFGQDQVVFNIVWTGGVFSLLKPLTRSVLRNSTVQLRFIANACAADEIAEMERFAEEHPDRLTDLVVASEDVMIRHGAALDHVLANHHDGPFFSLLDPDIFVRGPFLPDMIELLSTASAVTSGKEVWSDGNVRPTDHPGVNGEHFFDQDGFVFGSPHLAIYRAEELRETSDRWGVGFGSAGREVPERTKQRLKEVGRAYWVYDTGKMVNILLQADGRELVHVEFENLVHIGGVAHFLAPPSTAPAARDKPPKWGEGDDWTVDPAHSARASVARYSADLLRSLRSGDSLPALPDAGHLSGRLEMVRDGLIEIWSS